MTSFYTDIAKFAVKDLKIMSVFAESTSMWSLLK